MAKKQKKEPCFIKLGGDAAFVSLDTQELFCDLPVANKSPIDIYIDRNKSLITKIGDIEGAGLLDIESEDDRHIYNFFLLGIISNVESYFRSVIRESIIIDPTAYKKCLEAQVSYAAAIHHNEKLLPEALLEQCTFISKKNVADTLSTFLDISIAKQDIYSKEVCKCLDLFEQLCQLRHCIVHRAGLLGSKNAVKLGIESHKDLFERPIRFNATFLQRSYLICLNTVKTANNLLFNTLVHRYIEKFDGHIHWDFRRDKKWFKQYFDLFYSDNLESTSTPGSLITLFNAYDSFRQNCKD